MGVVHVGRRGCHRVDQLVSAVDADVRLHAEVPLVALLGLVHLRVTLAVAVLGRTRRADDRRIDDRTGADLEALLSQVRVDRGEDLRAQLIGLQQMAELADRRLVRHRLAAQVDADELAHRTRIVQRFLDRRIGQVEAVLQAVDAQHPLQSHRRAPCAFALLNPACDSAARVPAPSGSTPVRRSTRRDLRRAAGAHL